MKLKQHMRLAKILTDILENKFGIGKFKFGFDPILGAFPGVGDLISLSMSCYLVWIGIKMKIPQDKIFEMVGNILLDFIIGLFPLIGDIADVAFKANSRNMKILNEFSLNIIEADIV